VRPYELNSVQEEAVRWCGGHQLVLAGAGSGKTRVLTSKIAYLVEARHVPPWKILAVTFTNKAAREMLERVKGMVGDDLHGMSISTFHSWGLRFLQRNRESMSILGFPPNFVVFDRGDCRNLVRKIVREVGGDPASCGELMENISAAYSGCDPLTLESDMDGATRRIYERYRESLRSQGAIDFDDLMILPLHILNTDETILENTRNRLEWILVDEYQDVNTPQYLLLKLLSGHPGHVMAVGDPDQSIYGWRGADINLIMNFENDFEDARVFILDQNYRSTGSILAAANSVIMNNSGRHEKNLWTSSGGGAPVRVIKFANDIGEAEFIADEIERLVSGLGTENYDYKDICVLYRMNALSRGYEQSLLERGIPYRVVRGTSYYERKEIKDMLAMMRLAVNPRDEASLERVANIPARGLGKKAVAVLAAYLREAGDSPDVWGGLEKNPPLKGRAAKGVSELAGVMSGINDEHDLESAINYILYNGGYYEYLRDEFPDDWQDRLENVREIASIMPSGSIAAALSEAAIYTDQEILDSYGSHVNLLTLHAAKGLEFPVVFMAGMEEDIFPSAKALDESDSIEEERRLCYVGMTRAREMLFMSGAVRRRLFGGERRSRLSRFVHELPDTVTIDNRAGGGDSDVFRGGNRRNWRW
jgi:DNA helicase-2/ATP-dependent DNA helicase PcrA